MHAEWKLGGLPATGGQHSVFRHGKEKLKDPDEQITKIWLQKLSFDNSLHFQFLLSFEEREREPSVF